MKSYQVIARKFRPQTFKEVINQEPVVTTLKNAIRFNRLAHAYLFCGSRGTGKTTLARILSKALNCQDPTKDLEPCNSCFSCKEINSGQSLDVLEIDGASHRGIEDIRQINETIGFTPASGKYKIYIIDEVHMLTKEAFNALLKTLEEPPKNVLFFFATTEPHKVLPTIISRCQRFNLGRISEDKIIEKLTYISKNLNISIEDEALSLIASRAGGGLRDAESLLDQVFSFHDGEITVKIASQILGVVSKDCYFSLDKAGKKGQLEKAFDITHEIFSQGKDFTYFIEGLLEHYRNIIAVMLSGKDAPYLTLSSKEKELYAASARLYRKDQCLEILEDLISAQTQIKLASSKQIFLESLLLKIMRSFYKIPVEVLVHRLTELENSILEQSTTHNSQPSQSPLDAQICNTPAPLKEDVYTPQMFTTTKQKKEPPPQSPSVNAINKTPAKPTNKINPTTSSPTPTPIKDKKETKKIKPLQLSVKEQGMLDTLLQFTAAELEGSIQKNTIKQ